MSMNWEIRGEPTKPGYDGYFLLYLTSPLHPQPGIRYGDAMPSKREQSQLMRLARGLINGTIAHGPELEGHHAIIQRLQRVSHHEPALLWRIELDGVMYELVAHTLIALWPETL